MNAKQAAREAAKRIEDLEITLSRAMSDIKRYNQCIDSMIEGGSPCDWCEDRRECHLEAQGKGCGLWMLSYEEEEDNGRSYHFYSGAAGGIGGGVFGVGSGGTKVSESFDGIQPDAGDGG